MITTLEFGSLFQEAYYVFGKKIIEKQLNQNWFTLSISVPIEI